MRYRHQSQRFFAAGQLDPRLRAGLIGHWLGPGFGPTLHDLSGYGHHAALDTAARWTVGEGGKRPAILVPSAATSGGTTQAPILTGAGAFSLAAWVWLDTAGGGQSLGANYAPANPNGVVFYLHVSGKLNLYIAGSVLADTTMPTKAWCHVAVTRDGSGGVQHYHNGRPDGSGTNTNSIPGAANWQVGTDGYAEVLNGALDDVRVYDRALSHAEVALLAAGAVVLPAGRRRLYVPPPVVVTPPPASAGTEAIAPTVILGPITITPPPAAAGTEAIAPTVILGPITITPPPAAAGTEAIPPTIAPGTSTSGVPAGWTLRYTVGVGTVTQVASGTGLGASLAVSAAGLAGLFRSEALVVGATYRLSGRYKLAAGSRDDARIELLLGTAGAYVGSDGRHVGTMLPALELNTDDRGFCFDFVAPATPLTIELRLTSSAAAAVRLDRVRLQRIHRWELHEPRLPTGGVPTLEDGEIDPYFSGARVGAGTLRLVNADGGLDAALAGLDWLGHEVGILAGGTYPDGQEVTIEDAEPVALALVQRVSGDDRHVQLETEDSRATVHRDIPDRTYSAFDLPGLDPEADSKRRPLLLGPKTNISPIRMGLASGYGVYEVADCAIAVAGIKAVTTVRAYVDDESRTQADTSRSVTLAAGTDYSVDLGLGQLTLLRDVGPYEVVEGESDRLDFSVGGAAIAAALTPGLYTAADLAAHVAAVLTAAAATTISASYSQTTYMVTVSKASGALELLLATGTNKDRSGWRLLGFSGSADLTGSLSYVGAQVLFTGPGQHRLAVDAEGYADDGDGTYTGTPGALITLGPDVARFVWRRLMGRPLARIDDASFVAARAACPQRLGIYVGASTSTRVVLDQIETSVLADISIDGAGVVYFEAYGAAVAPVAELLDRDLLASAPYSEARSTAAVYARVTVQYDPDPTSGRPRARTAAVPAVEAQHGRPQARDFATWLTSGDDAQMLANRLSTLAGAAPVVASGAVKGALLRARPGQRITITRARAPFAPGGRTADPFRLLSLRRDPITAVVQFEAVEHVEV